MTDQPVTITLSAETVRWVKLAVEEIERVKWDIRPWGPGHSAIATIHNLIERGGDARVVKLVDEMESQALLEVARAARAVHDDEGPYNTDPKEPSE